MDDIFHAIKIKEELDGRPLDGTSGQISITYVTEREYINQTEKKHKTFPQQQGYISQLTSFSMPVSPMFSNNSFYPTISPYYSFPSVDSSQTIMANLYPNLQLSKITNTFTPIMPINGKFLNNILHVRNLPPGTTAKMIFKLFGAYGNVMKVKIFFKNPENALVEFQNHLQANLAKSNLNGCPFFGKNLYVTDSKPGIVIDTSSLKRGENNDLLGDYSNSDEHRYKFAGSKNHYNIAPPSKVLHLSNLPKEKPEDFYRELFKGYGNIAKFLFLKNTERMALIQMDSIDEAIAILVNFHNYNIDGKFLKVSFSKYQVVKDDELLVKEIIEK